MSRMLPPSVEVNPAIIRRTVLLPPPLDPRRTKSSPSAISSVTRSTTAGPPKRLVNPSRTMDMRLLRAPRGGPRREAEEEEEDREGEERQDRRDRVGVRDVAGLELGEDVEGRGLRAQPQVAGDHHGRAELSERMGERQQGPRDEAAAQGRQQHEAKRRPPGRADRVGRFLVGRFELVEHRLHGSEHVGKRHEEVREQDARGPEHRLEAERVEQLPEEADRAPEEEERGADDDRRDRDGEVDDDAERPVSPETVLGEDVGRERAEHRGDGGRREGDQQGKTERELRLGRLDGVPEGLRASAQREDEDGGERHEQERQQQEEEHADRKNARAPAGLTGAHFPSSLRTRSFHTGATISFLARFHPPMSAIRKGSWMGPKAVLPSFNRSITLRNPYSTKSRCASSVQRNRWKASTRSRLRREMLRSMRTSVCSERIVARG